MWRILLEEFWGDIRAQRRRAMLTVSAVTRGAVAVVVLLAFGEGLKQSLDHGLLNAGERIMMIWGGETGVLYQGLPKGRRIRLQEADLEALQRSIPDIDLVSPSYGRDGVILKYGDHKTNTYMEAVYPSFEAMRHMYPAARGRFLNQQDLDRRRRVLFLGNDTAERLFGKQSGVGRAVLLDGLPFIVVGVMQKKFQDSNNNGPDANRAIIPASTYKAIYGGTRVDHLVVHPRDASRAPVVKQGLYDVLGRRYRFDPSDTRALDIWDFIEDQRQTHAIGLGIQIFMGLVGVFTLLVGGVGVANVMYVTVKERTREIGIKLAVGARKTHIMAQFVFEALLITMGGGLIGLAIGWVIVAGVNRLPTADNPAMQYIAHPILSWPLALLCVAILATMGLLAGILPARKAASVDPVESLRYE